MAACGTSTGPNRRSEPAPSVSPAPPQLDYCSRLQPLLTEAVSSARIGTEMFCLNVPGVTELGRFGSSTAGEESTLASCFDDPAEYQRLLETSESELDLTIRDAFTAQTGVNSNIGLTRLVPWLPQLDVDLSESKRVTARVSLKRSRFVTLMGLASRIQGQRREQECLEALCRPDYTYVNKALVGVPTLTLTAEDAQGRRVGVGAAIVSGNYTSSEQEGGSRSITSTRPVTLAIARSTFRTAQTERLCQFCGRRGQGCCATGAACDGGLGCVQARCVEVGGPDQPCDGLSCSSGVCVAGHCRNACGGKGQPCCAGNDCSGVLRCTADPDNALERGVAAEEVRVEGGFFGTSEDRTFGGSSCGELRTRARFAVTKLGSGRGSCEKAWWFDPANHKDCRVTAHFDVSTFGSLRCRVEVFATAPQKPNSCQP